SRLYILHSQVFSVLVTVGEHYYRLMSYPPNYGFGGGQQGGYPAYPPAPGAPYPPAGGGYPPAPGAAYPPAPGAASGFSAPGGAPGYPPAPGGAPGYPSYPPAAGSSPYPPAPGGYPSYPPSAGSSPYPPAPGMSPYPGAPGSSPYPPAPGASPYPSSGASPYPPAQGGSAYGSQGGYAAPPGMGGSPYPQAGGNQYAQAGAPPGGRVSPYPMGDATGGSVSPYPTGAPTGGSAGSYPTSPAGGAPALSPSTAYQSSSGIAAPSAPQLIQYTERPTLKPMTPFDPSSDAQILRKAMKGLGTDEAAIIGVLARRTSQQRQEIILKFQQGYGRDLIKDLKSELSGKFEQVIIALMTPLPIYLARELHHAIQGIGTNEKTLVEILCSNDNAWILAIKNSYYQEFHRKLEDDIKGDTSGDFERVLVSMCAACRDEQQCDTALANGLAQQLYKAGEGRMGTNEGEFNRILATYSFPLLRCVFEEYKKINGRTLGQAISSEFSGDIKTGFKAIYLAIENRSAYFAKEIHDSMAGMGTNDRALIRMVVSRSEIDMGNIKEEYMRMYNKPMEKDIKDDCSGDYKRALIALCEEM
ncbi:unnamed protein product, partial [Meganyctiphanes norvegica]